MGLKGALDQLGMRYIIFPSKTVRGLPCPLKAYVLLWYIV